MVKIVRKLYKKGEYSYSINIPKEVIDKYGWKEKQKITIEDKGRGVLEIKDWRKR
ncbi:MAG: hypothetical protein U9Q12_02040 [Patescibacteria group bacterium]|nr:hypothetical protein [Patescibacteria group bacterium]